MIEVWQKFSRSS